MMEEIDRLEKGGRKEDVERETKEICERLSGHPYESLMPGQGDDHRA
jgi:oligogalacturonide transporter